MPKEVVAPDQAWIALPLHQCVDLRRPWIVAWIRLRLDAVERVFLVNARLVRAMSKGGEAVNPTTPRRTGPIGWRNESDVLPSPWC